MASRVFRSITLRLAPPLIYRFMQLLQRTIRWTELNADVARGLWEGGRGVIIVFWHNRMLMPPFFYRGRGLKILISRHADGELIRRVMGRFLFGSVRGSSRRGGASAFRELVRSSRQGWDIAITPDGPRGPRYVVQRGVIELSRRTGSPILPLTYSARRRFHCPSWDGFLIPRPFTRGVFIWGRPISVDPTADAQQLEECRRQLEEYLCRLTREADRFFESQRFEGGR